MKAVLIYVSFEHKQIFGKKIHISSVKFPREGNHTSDKMWRNLFENNRSKIKKLILKKRENCKIPTLPRWEFLNMKAVLIYVFFEHTKIFGKKSTFPRWSFPLKGITRLIKCGEIFSKTTDQRSKKHILRKRENCKIPTLPRWDFLSMKAVLIYLSFEHKQIFWKKSVFLGAVSPVKGITRLIKCGGIFSKTTDQRSKKLILTKRENREIPTLPRWDFLRMKAVLIYPSFEHKQIFWKKIRFPRCSFPRKGNHTSDKMWRNLFENNRSKIKKLILKKRENREIPTLPRWDFLRMKAVLIYPSFEHKQIFGKKSVFLGAVSPVKGITRLIKCGEIFSKTTDQRSKNLS